jgi:hypothetical protein
MAQVMMTLAWLGHEFPQSPSTMELEKKADAFDLDLAEVHRPS